MLTSAYLCFQVPLGTVVHKLKPVVEEDEGEEPFTFQQHWVGARDYVSSEEEEQASDAEADVPADLNPTSPPNSEVTCISAVTFLLYRPGAFATLTP